MFIVSFDSIKPGIIGTYTAGVGACRKGRIFIWHVNNYYYCLLFVYRNIIWCSCIYIL